MQATDRWFDEMERLLVDLNIRSGHLTGRLGFQPKDVGYVINAVMSDRFYGTNTNKRERSIS